MTSWRIIEGDCREALRSLDAGCIQTCVTSPPYYSLRDYGHRDQIGLEASPDEYVGRLLTVFDEVWRVLADDGTLWLNLGDSYGGGKQLLGVPWRMAFALQRKGWVLRSDVIWAKPNPMPESVTDRPTKAHEYLFLLSKGRSYLYDADAIREEWADDRQGASGTKTLAYSELSGRNGDSGLGTAPPYIGRNKRSVWTVTSQPFPGAHFATFPPKLIEPCILAGSREGDTVLDPFSGSGTTGMVALRHGRSYVGCELNSEYVELSRRRICDDAPLLNMGAEAA